MTVLRSMLFAPANNLRRIDKAFLLGADAVILDLEDACPAAEKIASRSILATALGRAPRCLSYVRVNALATSFAFGDVAAAVQAGASGIVLPKVEHPADVRIAEWILCQLERENGLTLGAIDLIATIETAAGFEAVQAIACSGTRVKRLAFGAGDLSLDIGMTCTRDEIELLPFRSAIVLASRAARLEAPIDTAWIDLGDHEGFSRSAERARALGFQGKMCIHPTQVSVANELFVPGADEIENAKRVVDAFAKAQSEGSAAFQIDGQFVDYAIVCRARRVIERAEYIAARGLRERASRA